MDSRMLITIGKPMEKDEWIVCLSDGDSRFALSCERVDWAIPCYGKELQTDEIKRLINFLQDYLIIKEVHNE